MQDATLDRAGVAHSRDVNVKVKGDGRECKVRWKEEERMERGTTSGKEPRSESQTVGLSKPFEASEVNDSGGLVTRLG